MSLSFSRKPAEASEATINRAGTAAIRTIVRNNLTTIR